MNGIKVGLVFCWLSILLNGVFGQKQVPDTTLQKIDQLFIKNGISQKTPGYVVGGVQDTSFLVNKGYGLANLEHEVAINEFSAFNVASLSKQFTAACIALLLMEDKINLEDPVNRYIDNFPNKTFPLWYCLI